MSKGRRIAGWIVGAFALWIVVLAIVGSLYGGRAGARVATRLADKLDAQVTIDSTNLALVRGDLQMSGFKIRKDHLGKLEIDIGEIDCDLRPLGLLLFDRTCTDLVIDKVRFSATSVSVFQFNKSKRTPTRAAHVVIRDAMLTFSPSAFLPELGKIEIKVDYVEAGETTFKTPMSWMFSMKEMRATLDLPASIVIKLHYKDGMLTASGGIFGSSPVTLPISIPVADSADDSKAEVAKIVAFARDLAKKLVAQRAEDWLKSKLPF
ncbi:MAG: hypothetical protein JWP01_1708 [Myxococcales bacterium]|nr:hypothetical protein [Myxococcales bacterium]